MIEIDFSKCKLKPYAHQRKGAIDLLNNPVKFLAWEMRLGKTAAVLIAANMLFEEKKIDALVVTCPDQVKSVWVDQELGEIKKHSWVDLSIRNWNAKTAQYGLPNTGKPYVVVPSLEFLRQTDAQDHFHKVRELLAALKGLRFWHVHDEGTTIANVKSDQFRCVNELRQKAVRATLLDGTPVGNSNKDLYAKFKWLDPNILGYRSFTHFAHHHIVYDRQKRPKSFKNVEIITEKGRPFVSRLTQDQCLDMPRWVEEFTTVKLSNKTWNVYCEMRDEMCAQIDKGLIEVNHIPVKFLRLAQICAGFVGGLENEITHEKEVVELSDETTDHAIKWLNLRLEERSDFKAVVWCRWQPEIERLVSRLKAQQKFDRVAQLWSKVKEGTEHFHPDTVEDKPWSGVIVAQAQAGRFGKNFSKADTNFFLSQDYDRVTRSQAKERIQGPGIRKTSGIVDVFVTGPEGQKTVIADIIRAQRSKEENASRTVAQWRQVLTEE